MAESVLDLAQRGRTLAVADREQLVELLLETLVEPAAPEVDEAWGREIERRVAAHMRGGIATYALEDVLADARRIVP